MLTNQEIRSEHRIAVLASVDVVNTVTPNDLHRATPCDGWDLSQRLCARRGPMKALVAIERAMLVAAYGMLTNGE